MSSNFQPNLLKHRKKGFASNTVLTRRAIYICATTLAISACSQSTNEKDKEIENYLLSHPQTIQKSLDDFREKQAQQKTAAVARVIEKYRNEIEHDPRDPEINPRGAITVTEFFDFRCPHCVSSNSKIMAILKSNPDVRLVFKELPIFGQISEKAAAAELAVKESGGDVLVFHNRLMSTKDLSIDKIDASLREIGINPTVLNDATLNENINNSIKMSRRLSAELDLRGTPSFIVGNSIITGEDMDALSQAIDKLRMHRQPSL